MAFLYMLDTNIISDIIRNPRGKVVERVASAGEDTVCTSIVVACELRFGAHKRNVPKLSQDVENILRVLPILPLQSPVENRYAEIRTSLERAGTPIGPNDLLIAAHALALDLSVVTANVREFSRVPNLRVENWLQPDGVGSS